MANDEKDDKNSRKTWLAGKKISFIGGGKMAEAIVSGMLAQKLLPPDSIFVSDPNPGLLGC